MSQPVNLSTQVLMMPDYRVDNPYQTLLAEALQQEQTGVYFPIGYRRVFPLFRALKDQPVPIQILHLHWINPYIKGETWLKRSIYSLKFLADLLICRFSGVKVAWTIHNRLSHEAQFPLLELWTIRQLVKLVDRIIVHHQAAIPELADLYQFNPDKAAVVPHGHYRAIYGEAIEPAEARAILGLPAKGRLFLNLGMLRPYKGIERLLRIWQEHSEIAAEHTLLIAGKPKEDSYGEQLSEQIAQIKGAVLHLGFVEDHLIPLYFSAADIVILPFENILTSGSLLLAMSYGKPIVAPRSPGIVETLGQADELLYSPQNDDELLHAIRKSVQSNLTTLKHLVNQECDRLSWEAIAQKTYYIYRTALTNES